MDGISGVMARIQQIESQFGTQGAGGVLGTGPGAPSTDTSQPQSFATALANAQTTGSSGTASGATTGLNRAGVNSEGWARDFLTKLNLPVTSENVRAISAWEQAEGTKAQFNPLATTQSGFSGETRFNSVGVKNYMSYEDGLDANVKALTNGRYGNILAALQSGNNAMAVADAIANSPWGTGNGVARVLQSQH